MKKSNGAKKSFSHAAYRLKSLLGVFSLCRRTKNNLCLDVTPDDYLSIIKNTALPDSQSDSYILKYVFTQDPTRTEERKQKLLDSIQRIEQFQRDNQVKPLALKVDSAIAICKKFKDSEEILSLGPSATIRWRGICHQDCESNGNIYCEYCRYFVI